MLYETLQLTSANSLHGVQDGVSTILTFEITVRKRTRLMMVAKVKTARARVTAQGKARES